MVVKGDDSTAGYKKTKREITRSEKSRQRSRLNFNISLFTQGNFGVLNSDEFVFDLIDYISDNTSNEEKKTALLKKLGQSSLSDDINLRERSLMVISLTAEKFLSEGTKNYIFLTAKLLTEWLYFEKEILSGHSVLVNRIGDLLKWLMLHQCWAEAENSVAVITKIQSEKLKKDRVVKVLITSVQAKLAEPEIVEKLTEHYLKRDNHQKTYKNLLISLGPGVVTDLLQKATSSQYQQEKSSLTNLILAFGEVAVPALIGFLEKRPTNAIIRIILHMIAELKEDSLCEHVRRYWAHEDVNVQYEAVRCIMLSGGKDMQMFLLEALEKVEDSIKHKIIRYLAETEGEREWAAEIVYKFAEERLSLSEPNDAELLKTVSAALKQYPFVRSIELLQIMQAKFKNMPGQGELVFHINESLRVLKPQIRHNLRSIDNIEDDITFDDDPVQKQIALKRVRKIESEIKYALQAGDTEAAGQILYRESFAAAEEKDFVTAEILRDRLLEIDPMALSDVLRLSQTIELEKEDTTAINPRYIWLDLEEEMTAEQRELFFDGMRTARYAKGTIISHNGEIDPSLYFIDAGNVGLSYGSEINDTFLKKMQPGDILGAEQFFSASVWTVTLKALTEVRVHVLDSATLQEIKATFPEIEGILRRYCRQYEQIPKLLEVSGEDRRLFPRNSGELVIKNVLLDPYGKKGKHYFKGNLIDISQGGLSFNIKISRSEKSRLLLGRQILTTIPVGSGNCIQGIGVIVGIKGRKGTEDEFSLHVQLLKKIDEEMMRSISNCNEITEKFNRR